MHRATIPSIDLSFPSELGYEKVAREAIGAFAGRLGFERERIEDLKTALCEACINAIEHGNAERPNLRVMVRCMFEQNELLIEVHDQGIQAYQGQVPTAPIEHKLMGAAPRRGMGLLLIMGLVDQAHFSMANDGGNVCRLTLIRRNTRPTMIEQK